MRICCAVSNLCIVMVAIINIGIKGADRRKSRSAGMAKLSKSSKARAKVGVRKKLIKKIFLIKDI